MNLLVLGASGGVGRWLVQLAHGQGNQVTAIARATARYAPPAGVRLVEGDVLSEPLLIQAMQGQHAVASCLGNRRLGKSPWARLQSPADFVAGATRAIVEAMRASEVRRIVAISGAGVGDSRKQLSALAGWMVSAGNIGVAYRDLAEMEGILAASGLDWLAVRPVTLTNGPPTHRAGPVSRFTLRSSVRRSDVAACILEALGLETPFAGHTAFIGTRESWSPRGAGG